MLAAHRYGVVKHFGSGGVPYGREASSVAGQWGQHVPALTCRGTACLGRCRAPSQNVLRPLVSFAGAEVDVEVSKSVLKLATVQHLYGRIAATLPVTPGVGARGTDVGLLAALHPTPAVCGRPQGAARSWLAEREGFDRGFYAGPFGWVTGHGAEFVVAIRSALLPGGGGVAEGRSGLGVQGRLDGQVQVGG